MVQDVQEEEQTDAGESTVVTEAKATDTENKSSKVKVAEKDPELKKRYKLFEMAYLKEAIGFLNITNLATGVEDAFFPDGTKIPKENLPQARVFEIMYILAGANRLIGNIDASNKFLEQIIYGASGAQGVILWFVNQAREMRHDESAEEAAEALEKDSEDEENGEESEEEDEE